MPSNFQVPCSLCSGMVRRIRSRSYQSEPICMDCRLKRHGISGDRMAQCPTCRVSFRQTRDRRKFCSNECKGRKAVATPWRTILNWVSCDWCSTPIVGNRGRKTCSYCRLAYSYRSCAVKFGICRRCGSPFTMHRMGPTALRCSPCRDIHLWEQKTRYKKVSKLVDYLGHRDAWRCGICHRSVSRSIYDSQNPMSKSVDHIIPVSQGGTDDPANLRLAHLGCNMRRSNKGGNEQLALVG